MTATKKKLGKNILSLGAVQVANYVLPLISVPIIARILGPDKTGTVSFAQAFVEYFTVFISYGFNLTGTRRLAADPNNVAHRNQVFSEVFNAQALLFCLSCVVFSICLILVPQLRKEWLTSLFAFSICISTLLTQNWLFQAMQDLPKVAILNLISKVLFTVGTLLIIRKQADYALYALAYSVVHILVAVASFAWSVRRYKLKLSWVPVRSTIELILKEKTYFFSLVVISLYTTTNVVILGFIADSKDVGIYSAGQRISAIILTVLILPFRQTFFPHVTRELKKNREQGLAVAQKLLPIIIWPTFVIGMALLIFGKHIIVLFYGPKFEQAGTVLQILAFLPMVVSLSNIWGIIVMMNLKLDKLYLRVTVFSALTSIALNLLLTPHFSYIGSAVSLLVSQIVGAALIFYYLKKQNVNLIEPMYFKPVKLNRMLAHQFRR